MNDFEISPSHSLRNNLKVGMLDQWRKTEAKRTHGTRYSGLLLHPVAIEGVLTKAPPSLDNDATEMRTTSHGQT